MWTDLIIRSPSDLSQCLCLLQRYEDFSVEEFIPDLPVEAFDVTVLLFQLLQTMGLGHFHAAVFLAPAVVGLFPDTEMASSLDNSFALGDQNLSLAEMTDDLDLSPLVCPHPELGCGY